MTAFDGALTGFFGGAGLVVEAVDGLGELDEGLRSELELDGPEKPGGGGGTRWPYWEETKPPDDGSNES